MQTPNHLGGHAGITHIDVGAMKWAIDKLEVKSALDVGCGPGDMVKLMLDNNIDALGIDGDPNLNWGNPGKFIRHDYTTGKLGYEFPVDLVWCVEVLEHVEEQYLDNLFETFDNARYVIVTAAPPGTESAHHHVNCQTSAYWKKTFNERGFRFKRTWTRELREASSMSRDFMRETGIVFENTVFD